MLLYAPNVSDPQFLEGGLLDRQAGQMATPGCEQTPRRASRPGVGPRRCASNPEEQPQL